MAGDDRAYTRVAVVGTGGYAGLFLRALLQSGHFGVVRAVTRAAEAGDRAKRERLAALRRQGAEVVEYDEAAGAPALQRAFAGIDVVVSGIGMGAAAAQIPMIDGAVLAGVGWFIPAEFGVPPYASVWLPFPGPLEARAAVEEHLRRHAQPRGLAHTIVYTGLALDYIDPRSIGLRLADRSATLVGRGGTPVSFTATADVVRLLVGVLRRPAEMRNRTVRFVGSTACMRDLVKIVTSGDRGENVRMVSVGEAKTRFRELAQRQDLQALQVYARLLLEEGLGQVNRCGEPLDNALFPEIRPEPVRQTLERLIRAADSDRLARASAPAVHRSDTGSSVTAGLGHVHRADAAPLSDTD
ncbi:hypothetical protein H4R18_002947 [Coemansia javaensis]|uniref:NmrA-like domain-containing protein n=1 Tax=Coemansia javaensis TaxID=2761396 RepID=A0A9W8HAB5_9FUNG|nr:hypothetical protein H4R18_002947 [Coemansia javaensis]